LVDPALLVERAARAWPALERVARAAPADERAVEGLGCAPDVVFAVVLDFEPPLLACGTCPSFEPDPDYSLHPTSQSRRVGSSVRATGSTVAVAREPMMANVIDAIAS
jgi:hypothetical protein